jgi:hypothetical protein
LVIDVNVIRMNVATELYGKLYPQPPAPEPAEFRPPAQRENTPLGRKAYAEDLAHAKEQHERAYQLRLMNHQAQITSTIRRENPLSTATKAATQALDRVAIIRGPHDRDRNGRPVDITTFVDPYGNAVKKIQPTDGRGRSIDPTIEQRRVEAHQRLVDSNKSLSEA